MRAIQFQNKRVGSTFLQHCLNSHPDIAGIDEIFVNMVRRPEIRKSGFPPFLISGYSSPSAYLNNVVYMDYPLTHTIFKLMYNQINWHQGLLEYVKRMPIIHLMRKNLVKQVVSFLKMAEYNDNPIIISPEELFNQVKEADNQNKQWSKKLNDQIKLTLYYEDIVGDKIGNRTYLSPLANKAICNFFGIKELMMFAETKKKNKDDMSVYLPNLSNIRERFNNTKYEWMLK